MIEVWLLGVMVGLLIGLVLADHMRDREERDA